MSNFDNSTSRQSSKAKHPTRICSTIQLFKQLQEEKTMLDIYYFRLMSLNVIFVSFASL